jgi:hypothetical protein
MIEDQVSSGVCHKRIIGKLLKNKLSDLFGVCNGNVDHEIFLTTEEENLHNLGMLLHAFHKTGEV